MACAAILSVSGRALAFCRLTTVNPDTTGRCGNTACATEGKPLVWQQRCISYTLGQREARSPTRQMVEEAVDAAFATWSNVTCGTQPLPLKLAGSVDPGLCTVPSYSKFGGNANTILFVDDLDEFNRDWHAEAEAVGEKEPPPQLGPEVFGLTLVFHDPGTGRIYGADMMINEASFALGTCGSRPCAPRTSDLQNVVTHEAGHFLGLGHSNESGSTMSACASVGETSKRDLTADDREGICAIYGDGSALQCTTQDFTPPRGFSTECASVTPAVRSSDAGGDGCSASPSAGGGAFPAWIVASTLTALLLAFRRARNCTKRRAAPARPA